MKTAMQVLRSKPDLSIHCVAPDASVFDAIRKMSDLNIGALLVMRQNDILGIVTERDYARKVVLEGRSSPDTLVSEVMTSPVQYVRPGTTTDECMAVMTESFVRHLPVLADGEIVGVLSIGDLVKSIISEQQVMIEQLQHYIAGDRV